MAYIPSYIFPFWSGYVQDENGDIVTNATITVREQTTGFLASLRDNPLSVTSKNNPFTTGSDGKIEFAVASGGGFVGNFYKITATKGAFSETIEYVMLGTSAAYNVGAGQSELMTRADIAAEFYGREQNNLNASVDPTINDDSDDGYANGSLWINTTSSPPEAFRCLDATVGAAVWVNTTLTISELGSVALLDTGTAATEIRTNAQNESFFQAALTNNLTAITDPTITNDVNEGYSVQSIWINTAASPNEVFMCTDNTAGAAEWANLSQDIDTLGTIAVYDQGTASNQIRTNLQNDLKFQDLAVERTVDPTANDDSDDGFQVGSIWVNTASSPKSIFVCVDDTVAAAIWREFHETPTNVSVFYVDWDDETKIIEDGDSLWNDAVTASTASPSGNIAYDTRSVLTVSSIVTPSGYTLDNYSILSVEAQIYINSTWTGNDFIFATTAGGTKAHLVNNTSIVVQTGENNTFGVGNRAKADGNASGNAVVSNSAPCRVRIACIL